MLRKVLDHSVISWHMPQFRCCVVALGEVATLHFVQKQANKKNNQTKTHFLFTAWTGSTVTFVTILFVKFFMKVIRGVSRVLTDEGFGVF